MIAVTEPIVEDLRERLGAHAVLITNGFDPEEVPAEEGAGSLLDPGRHSLVHTGRMEAARSTPRSAPGRPASAAARVARAGRAP